MKSDPPTCKLPILFIILLISLTTGELEFYQDVDPEISENVNVNLKNLERLFKSQNHHQYGSELHRSRIIPNYQENDWQHYTREKEKNLLKILLENPQIIEILQKNKYKNYINNNRPELISRLIDTNINNNNDDYYEQKLIVNDNENNNERPYVNLDSPSETFDYSKINIPYSEVSFNENDKYFGNNNRHIPIRMTIPKWDNYEVNKDNSLARYHSSSSNFNNNNNNNKIPLLHHHTQTINLNDNINKQPEFTYKLDEPDLNEDDMFAFKPNDPRFYEEDLPIKNNNNNHELSEINTSNIDNKLSDINFQDEKIKKVETVGEYIPEGRKNDNKFFSFRDVMSEPQRRAEIDPAVKSTSIIGNNDVYFIAIVAGCSAAAMFALVLISLTWCRIQRGAKAAADIDYPAYGVTGPNKDISPSGDQRLAHSAQMYHFQHQKQQIIAMEKTTASRDPGSVSEAESDEENEEGDYTVYECPGLAPAGEMEVKNPLFHDDPTPATPPVNHKDEDH